MDNLSFLKWVEEAKNSGEDYIVALVQLIMIHASAFGVSDLHFQPDKTGMSIWYRYDGVLHELGQIEPEHMAQMAARLKVLANLLTYRTTIPQEGRVQAGHLPGIAREMRISSMPTLFGERVVVRFFAEEEKYQYPDQLGLSPEMEKELIQSMSQSGGAIIICGPAGSGKTTTACSLLRHVTQRIKELRSVITLEDPVEHPLPRTAQIEVGSQGDIALPEMIKYTMRQDPEILFVGEIRDRDTALASFQAALTGHLLLTTFHAGSAVEAVVRLSEMGIEPFVLRSSIRSVVCQRLLRRLCSCAQPSSERITIHSGDHEMELDNYLMPVGCEKCSHTGYHGRLIIAESIPWHDPRIARAVLDRSDAITLAQLVGDSGMTTLEENAWNLVCNGITSPLEVQRVLGS